MLKVLCDLCYEVSGKEIEEFYQTNLTRYMTAEQLKIDFLEVSLERVTAMVDVSEDIKSVVDISANPNGILDVIKNKIVIRDKTDFN